MADEHGEPKETPREFVRLGGGIIRGGHMPTCAQLLRADTWITTKKDGKRGGTFSEKKEEI
jgi:hypothetical protein